MRRPLITGLGMALAMTTVLVGTAGAVTLKPGDVLVADYGTSADNHGAIIRVNPITGKQTLVSDNLQAVNSGDPLFDGPLDVDVLPNGRLVVTDYAGDQVLFVDPRTGAQSLIYRDPTSVIVNYPSGGVRAPNGRFVFAAEDSDPANTGAVLSLNLGTGAIATISKNDDPAGAPEFSDPTDLVHFNGKPLVVDYVAGPMNTGALITVNAGTGLRSTFATNETLLTDPRGILLAPNRKLFITDQSAGPGNDGGVFTVNPRTRAVAELASNADPGSDLLGDPEHIAVELGGRLLVADQQGPTNDGAVVGVDPRSGAQTLVSDNAQAVNASSQLMEDPFGITVVPPRCGGQFATIVGSNKKDKLKGTRFPDLIAGAGGNDVLRGLGGRDRICGGKGRDRLLGGKGADKLRGGPGRDLQVQ